MKVSSATSFGASGGHIFDVVAPGLKKHVFTAMLTQHVCQRSSLGASPVPSCTSTVHTV